MGRRRRNLHIEQIDIPIVEKPIRPAMRRSIKIQDMTTDHILSWWNSDSCQMVYAIIDEITDCQIFYTKTNGQSFSWLLESLSSKRNSNHIEIITKEQVPADMLELLKGVKKCQ